MKFSSYLNKVPGTNFIVHIDLVISTRIRSAYSIFLKELHRPRYRATM